MATVVNNNDDEDTSESVDHMTTIDKYLRSIDVSAKNGKICRLDRTVLPDGKTEQRANFIMFD